MIFSKPLNTVAVDDKTNGRETAERISPNWGRKKSDYRRMWIQTPGSKMTYVSYFIGISAHPSLPGAPIETGRTCSTFAEQVSRDSDIKR
jgi:hypothetical protein